MPNATIDGHPPWPVYSADLKAQRRKEWPVVRDVLKKLPVTMYGGSNAANMRMLKALYVDGVVPDRESRSDLETSSLLIYKLWFYPDDDLEVLGKFWSEPDPESLMKHDEDRYVTTEALLEHWPGFDRGKLPAPYGMMGGREVILGGIVIPNAYDQEYIDQIRSLILRPISFVERFFSHSIRALEPVKGGGYSPFWKGVDYLAACTVRLDPEYWDRSRLFLIDHWIKLLRSFDSNAIEAHRRVAATEFAEAMREGFSAGRFGEVLTERWQAQADS